MKAIRRPPTPGQKALYDFIVESRAATGVSPSVKEMMKALRIKSSNTVHGQLVALVRRGLLRESEPGMSRGYVPTAEQCCPHCRGTGRLPPDGGVEARPFHPARAVLSVRDDDEARFWSYVKKGSPDECWPWNGYRHPGRASGVGTYGVLNLRGEMIGVHRLSHCIHIGPVPDGVLVLHSCDNPPCVNPAHLRLGTHAENTADMVRRGRARSGRVKRRQREAA